MDEVEVTAPFDRHFSALTSPIVLQSDSHPRKLRFPVGLVLPVETSTGLTIEVAADVAGVVALRDDYRRLERESGVRIPFSLYEWHVAWCHHFLIQNRHVQMQPRFQVLRDRSGACVAIVPLILTRRRVGPREIATYDMLGADPAITEIRAPLIEPGYEARVAWMLQRRLREIRKLDWIHWTAIDGPLGETLAIGADLRWQQPLIDYVLDLPESWDQLYATLKRNIRESLRRCYNSLKRDGIEFSMRVVERPDAVAAAIDQFFELHAMRADMRGVAAHPDHFARVKLRRFLHDVCGRLAQRGVVRVFQLVIREQVVATRIGFVVGDSLYLYYSGFDPTWSRYSVMTTTVAEAIKYAIQCGLATVNLSLGQDVSKTRWGPREVQIKHALQISRSLSARVALAVFQHARESHQRPTLLRRWFLRLQRDWS